MYTQFIHATQRALMSPFDVITFVWGAVCQQVKMSSERSYSFALQINVNN